MPGLLQQVLTGDEEEREGVRQNNTEYIVIRAIEWFKRSKHVVECEADAKTNDWGSGWVGGGDTDDGREGEATGTLNHLKVEVLRLSRNTDFFVRKVKHTGNIERRKSWNIDGDNRRRRGKDRRK